MKTITLPKEDWLLIKQALTRMSFKEAEVAITFRLPNTEGPKFERIKDKIDLILNQQITNPATLKQ